jgi:CheY-like chemotaxis protein
VDVTIAGTDDWSILNQLKDDTESRNIPVVMAAINEGEEFAYSLGASDFLNKPIQRDQLLKILSRFVGINGNGSVLIVDDESDARDLIKRQLESTGVEIFEASGGRQALNLIGKVNPGLILLDLMMPEMDGFEFLDHLLETEAWKQTPVVIISAKDLTNKEREKLAFHSLHVFAKGSYLRENLADYVVRALDSLPFPCENEES